MKNETNLGVWQDVDMQRTRGLGVIAKIRGCSNNHVASGLENYVLTWVPIVCIRHESMHPFHLYLVVSNIVAAHRNRQLHTNLAQIYEAGQMVILLDGRTRGSQ
jgi:hypothetical protein